MAETKSKPILMSGAMVRAIIDGRKTQTRRIVKPQPVGGDRIVYDTFNEEFVVGRMRDSENAWTKVRPRFEVGSEMWVRETWKYRDWTDDGEPFIAYRASEQEEPIHIDASKYSDEWAERLAGIWAALSEPENYAIDGAASDRKWRSSRIMPRWASRLTLTVKDVRVERLQDISEEDAKAEGIDFDDEHGFHFMGQDFATGRACYAALWSEINGPGSWDANPWVWVYSFVKAEVPRG